MCWSNAFGSVTDSGDCVPDSGIGPAMSRGNAFGVINQSKARAGVSPDPGDAFDLGRYGFGEVVVVSAAF